MEAWQVIIVGVITVVGSVVTSRIAARGSVETKKLDVDASAYERAERINAQAFARLDERIDEQDKQIERLQKGMEEVTQAFRIAINFIEQFLLWERDGSAPPRPSIPEYLKKYLDPDLIREHIRQQRADERGETP